jgi:prepilin signal peptidase PulO-like enzyme (type II secretory pathway)
MTQTVILFVLGAIVGSFLNALGSRWNSSVSDKRSFCDSCYKKLGWWELVPIVSYFMLRGRCSGCKSKIPVQNLIIEIWTGLLFITVPYVLLPVFCLYTVIIVYDLRHKIIPDTLVYSAIVLSILYALFNLSTDQLINLAAGPIIFVFFAGIWLVSRGRAMGFGDAKLGLSIGLTLGASAGFSAIILSFWIGTAVVVIYMLFRPKKFTMKSEVPFAPFMILGAWLALIYDLDILNISQF